MAARTKARKRALDLLFEAEQRGLDPVTLAADRLASGLVPVPQYSLDLVEGVQAHRERIDELLETYSHGWPLDRMPAVDRNLLRIGVFELLWADDVPDEVVLSEAVGLVSELSTDESPSFVNGLLGRLLQLKPGLVES
ncbi:NusB antitermination factor [Quadrisphaera granulorum]|uniref:Transcription antitermination protein NusB n=1 Tax=Quadrisphaera granulorum TaxID=317664 RepID=A0A316AE02_9ACTN|nr:transcription antitermination factor NusB [Quadrisphaera granulorum]PWJ48007.1 NusB antitermination factor [Quadrisphaera granulorum]SZE98579.1 NusB antitermination factor [Quadrisphaera granulorum]